jgi:uncharacterized protein
MILGNDLATGQRPQFTVPAGVLQAATPAGGVDFALCGCTVFPGFDFADFTMPSRRELLERHPALADLIHRFTRE